MRLELSPVQAGETVEDDLRNHIWRGGVVDRSVANLMLHVPYSRELETRSELAVLVQPYYTEAFVVACDPARLEDEVSLAAFAGSTIGVELDSLPDFYLGSTLGGRLREGLVHYRRPEDGLDALLRGEITAFMGLRSQVEAGLGSERERFDLGSIPLAGLPGASWAIGAAVREDTARPRLCSRRHPGWRRARRHDGRHLRRSRHQLPPAPVRVTGEAISLRLSSTLPKPRSSRLLDHHQHGESTHGSITSSCRICPWVIGDHIGSGIGGQR